MIWFVSFASLLSIIIYVRLIISYKKGWDSIPEFEPSSGNCVTNNKLSVIIAFRNEEKNVERLLNQLKTQNLPMGLFECIFVDDHSEDQTFSKLNAGSEEVPNFHVLRLPESLFGKKAALEMAFHNTTGRIIVQTDADCNFPQEWLKTIAEYFETHSPGLLIAPVLLSTDNFLGELQQLEFMSLMATTCGAVGLGKPIMCNGANLAYAKNQLKNYKQFLSSDISSGDDMFLLEFFKKQNNENVHYLKSKNGTVTTSAEQNLVTFLQQRMRWASKGRHYKDKDIISASLTVLLVNFMLFCCLLFSFWDIKGLIIAFFLILAKSIPDLLILKAITSFYQTKKLLSRFPILQILYFVYVVIVAFGAQITPIYWKNRIITK